MGQILCLIVSVPELCLLSYFTLYQAIKNTCVYIKTYFIISHTYIFLYIYIILVYRIRLVILLLYIKIYIYYILVLCIEYYDMGLNERKPVFGGSRTTKVQTSLHIRAV